MSEQVTLIVQFAGTAVVSLVLSVGPRRGLQQCYSNISVFILV